MLARSWHDDLARAFLFLYVPFSVLVLGGLLVAYTQTLPAPPADAVFVVEYLEAFIGFYGVMIGLPLFVHQVFGVRSRGRNVGLVAVVVIAFGLQHVTEFVLGGVWDDRGDVAEDLLFVGVLVYSVWTGFDRWHADGVYRPLARRLFTLLLLGIPVWGHDLAFVDGPGLRLYPIWYCVAGLATIVTIIGRRTARAAAVPPAWELSPREEEVVQLVQRGLSTRQVARKLSISPNTVKTHLRAIFDKSGFRTRIALIAALSEPEPPGERSDHPVR